MAEMVLREVRPAPTLVKYAEASPYLMQTREQLGHAAAEIMEGAAIHSVPPVDLLDDESLEVELATTLLYEHCAYPYRQIHERICALSDVERREIINLGLKHRGPHDELLRPFSAGQQFRFDILMDIGGFRDLHRHRRCVQIHQAFTQAHGYDIPDDLASAGVRRHYESVMDRVQSTVAELKDTADAQTATVAIYMLPLAFRKRTLFKMDLAEAAYVSELRTGPAGHFSYRQVAYLMYEAVAQRYPELARHFRVTDICQSVDLLKR
jgi:hypothetical protein